MILKKLAAIGLAGIMAASLMACGGGNSAKTEGSSANGGKQKLVIWSWGADEEKKSRESMVEVFKKAHPEIEVEHSVIPTADHVWDQKMTAALSAGTGPDVIQMSPDYYGLYTKYYEDLNPYVEKEGVDLKSVTTEGMIEPYYRPDGKLEAMPLLENVFVLAYNKDMFDKFGVSYPTADWTWDDLAEAAKKFAGGEGADATYGIVNHWIDAGMSIICKGGSAYSDDLKTLQINSQEVKDGLTLFGDLIQSGAMPDDTAAKSLPKEQLFVSGHAAMYTLGGFETKLISDEVGDNFQWDAVPMPKVANGGKNNLMYATGYAMVNTAKNKDAAWTFLKEAAYTNEDMAKETCKVGLTSCKTVAESYYKDIKNGPISNSIYLDGLASAKLNIWGGAFSAVGDVWTQIWQSVTIDKKTADEAMNEYYPALEKAFNEANSK
ncbi:ABC transporter substrate-binding protein [Anaerocolumna sp. MB42-C2]|uniref:ABC transporter substrate-binding protein n=1 Tax=Anaerocolumna sp. MB42-C2 TaxID=3070997 RepID=UPI0027E0371C|nr:sugar ABC transporter substrate-binding protein [Anaerocolumna sp. MB42-C2]WMJ89059.1 sugar ABC transporter substrate-binding protein [Anaerocolumna sp. MB42-C2]